MKILKEKVIIENFRETPNSDKKDFYTSDLIKIALNQAQYGSYKDAVKADDLLDGRFIVKEINDENIILLENDDYDFVKRTLQAFKPFFQRIYAELFKIIDSAENYNLEK